MKASLFLAVSGAILAAATPVEKEVEKRHIQTTWVKETCYVTVTEGELPAKTAYPTKMLGPGSHVHHHPHTYKPKPKPTTTVVYVESPKPVVVKPKPSPAPVYQQAPSDYAGYAVHHHNIHRQNHSAPAISWSDALTSYAQQTADSCVFAHNLGPGGGGYGQNLAVYGASGDVGSMDTKKIIGQAVTDMWYNGEINYYSGYGQANPDMSQFENFGHFTQVVWAGSTQVGCVSKFCPAGTIYPTMGSWFTVCDYSPPGNMGGAYGQNVKAPVGDASVSV